MNEEKVYTIKVTVTALDEQEALRKFGAGEYDTYDIIKIINAKTGKTKKVAEYQDRKRDNYILD